MTLTQIFMGIIVIVVAALDVYIIKKKGKQKSFSAYIIRYVNHNRLAFFTTLGIGIVMGHVFWSMSSFDYMKEADIIEECKQYTARKN